MVARSLQLGEGDPVSQTPIVTTISNGLTQAIRPGAIWQRADGFISRGGRGKLFQFDLTSLWNTLQSPGFRHQGSIVEAVVEKQSVSCELQ